MCGFAGGGKVSSTEGAILWIPGEVLGIALYTALPLLVYMGRTGIALPIAIVAVLGSAYLGYVDGRQDRRPLHQLHQRRRREPADTLAIWQADYVHLAKQTFRLRRGRHVCF